MECAKSSCSGSTPAKELCPALLSDRVQRTTGGRKKNDRTELLAHVIGNSDGGVAAMGAAAAGRLSQTERKTMFGGVGKISQAERAECLFLLAPAGRINTLLAHRVT